MSASKNQHYTKIFNYLYVLRCNITCFSSIGVTAWYNPKHLFRWWQRRSHWRQRRYRRIWKRRGDSFRSLVVNLSYWCWRQLLGLSMVVSGSLYTANWGDYIMLPTTYYENPKINHWLFGSFCSFWDKTMHKKNHGTSDNTTLCFTKFLIDTFCVLNLEFYKPMNIQKENINYKYMYIWIYARSRVDFFYIHLSLLPCFPPILAGTFEGSRPFANKEFDHPKWALKLENGKYTRVCKWMAQLPCIGLYKPCINLPFGNG